MTSETKERPEAMVARIFRGDIGAAWSHVEEALPKGYAIMLRGSNDWAGRGPTWKADAYHSDGRRRAWHVEAETAAGALDALAVRLRGSDREGEPG